MKPFRKTKKSTLYLWTVLLSIALLCAQGVKLHVHTLDHDHDHNHINVQSAVEHSHLSIAHLTSDVSHADHHEGVLAESDACPDGLLMKFSGKVHFMALLAIFFTWVLFGLHRYTLSRRDDDNILSIWRYHLTPPLRAPPC